MDVTSNSGSATIRRQRIVRLPIVAALLLISGALRLSRLEQLPPGLFIDESANSTDALGVLQGHHAFFFPENQAREGMVICATALAVTLFGRTITAGSRQAALASVGTVLAAFWLGVQSCSTNGAAMGENSS